MGRDLNDVVWGKNILGRRYSKYKSAEVRNRPVSIPEQMGRRKRGREA